MRRTDAVGAVLMAAANDLEAHRRELHAFRKVTFESYVAQNPPPPNYALAREPISAPSTSAPAFPVPQSQIGEEDLSTNRDDDNTPSSGPTVQSQVIPSWPQIPEADLSPSWGTSACFLTGSLPFS
jgi:hypothetical protein